MESNLFILMFTLFVTGIDAERCRNTKQGISLITDDQGRVCERFELTNGCCPSTSNQYLCEGCSDGGKCCDVYEHCVSCCLQPKFESLREIGMKERKHNPLYKFLLKSDSVDGFRYCRARCRTSMHSVYHQNKYSRSNHHFCYSSDIDDRDTP